MAKGTYIGVGGVARKVNKAYIGVGGVARKVKKVYIGVGGVARLCWSGELKRWVVAGRDRSATKYITCYSDDSGSSWTLGYTFPSNSYIRELTYGKNMFVGAGSYDGVPAVYTSVDGVDWEVNTNIPYSLYYLTTIAYAQDKFVIGAVAASRGTPVWYSTDGFTWTQAGYGITNGYPVKYLVECLGYSSYFGRWIVATTYSYESTNYTYQGALWYSTDLLSWTQAGGSNGMHSLGITSKYPYLISSDYNENYFRYYGGLAAYETGLTDISTSEGIVCKGDTAIVNMTWDDNLAYSNNSSYTQMSGFTPPENQYTSTLTGAYANGVAMFLGVGEKWINSSSSLTAGANWIHSTGFLNNDTYASSVAFSVDGGKEL